MNVEAVAIDAAWLLMAAYGLRIQTIALTFAWRNWKVARVLPLNHVLVMAHARLRSNAARLSIICVNALIGVVAIVAALIGLPPRPEPTWVLIVNLIIAIGFTGNEMVMLAIAQLEVNAHRKLVRSGIRQ